MAECCYYQASANYHVTWETSKLHVWRIPCQAPDCVTWWCKWELGWSYNIIHIDFVTWWCKRDQMGWSYLWCYHEYRSRSLGGDGKKQENKNAATSMYLNFWAMHARENFVTKRLQLAHSCTSGLLVVSQSCNDDWFKAWQVEDSSTKLWRFNDNLDGWQIKANAACCCPHLSSSSSSSSSSWASRC